jgi:kynurenine formamidase
MATTRREPTVSLEQLRERFDALRNWNRWGPDDEVGTVNFVTPELIVEAARLVRRGAVFSLAIELNYDGPQKGTKESGIGRFNPVHLMTATGADAVVGAQDLYKVQFADDVLSLPLHAGTHWDALCHVFYEGKMYNGYPAENVSAVGASTNGVEKLARRGMVGRGVLLDVARYKGVHVLEPGYGITCADLDGCAEAQGVEVRSGDFVLIRTGQMDVVLETGSWGDYAGGDAPGPAFETLTWMHDREVAAAATDTWGFEVRPNETDEDRDAIQPYHWVAIPSMGLPLGEFFRLDELGRDCAEDGRYEFLLVAAPLPVTGATGAVLNPIAIK